MTLWWNHPEASLEAFEHYQKGYYRNRCILGGPNGPLTLSIPLQKGKHQQTPIREVRIDNDLPWQRQHWRTIVTAYGSAPYFPHFEDDFRQFYATPPTFLFDLNLRILEKVSSLLGSSRLFSLTDAYQKSYAHPNLDLRNRCKPGSTNNLQGFTPVPYPQVFQEKFGFQADLSILDLMLCCGKTSTSILESAWMPARV
jgi:hypothetical protein